MSYDRYKRIEQQIIDYYINKFKEVDKLCRVVDVDRYSPADLIIQDNRGNYHCLEIKVREEPYTLEYVTIQGTWVEKNKLDRLKELYDVNSFTLITITSDKYFIRTIIDYDCEREERLCKRTTAFRDYERVKKIFLVQKKFEQIGKAQEIGVEL